jgi:hypothetical protein
VPFPLISSPNSIEEILQDPKHLAFRNVSRQTAAQKLYVENLYLAEQYLEKIGAPVSPSVANALQQSASRIYGILEKLGGFFGTSEELTYEMVRLAFGIEGDEAKEYLEKMETKMNEKSGT